MRAGKWRSAGLAVLQVTTLAWASNTHAEEPIYLPVLPSDPPSLVPPLPVAPVTGLPEATTVAWPNGRLAQVLCGNLPLSQSLCHLGDYTGTLVTYHASGSTAEVLSFAAGLLDGLYESYDETGTSAIATAVSDRAPRSARSVAHRSRKLHSVHESDGDYAGSLSTHP